MASSSSAPTPGYAQSLDISTMPKFERDPSIFGVLKDRVIVLSGGARGVRESVARSLYAVWAHVFFGDIDDEGSKKLVESLKAENPSAKNSLVSIAFDARKYGDNISLFKIAHEAHGRVDHAFTIAAVTENVNWYDENLDLSSIEIAPPTTVLDVNFTGVLYFVCIATAYLRQSNDNKSQDKSICLLGSIASFKEQAGLFVYQPTKHGIMGLFRTTRNLLYHKYKIRINMVNPSHINTIMGSSVHQLWVDHNLPVNEAHEVAEHVLTLAAAPESQNGTNTGLAVYVEGGEGWDIEKDLDDTDHIWMGEVMARNCARIYIALGTGVDWKPKE